MWSRKDSSAENYATGVRFLNIYEGGFSLLESYVKTMRVLLGEVLNINKPLRCVI